jgi:hypothetical protein
VVAGRNAEREVVTLCNNKVDVVETVVKYPQYVYYLDLNSIH